MKKWSSRLHGHAQRDTVEYDFDRKSWSEIAKCECGESGGFIDSRRERRLWHRDHKNQLRVDAFLATEPVEQTGSE